jgi:hypothetical protein
LLNKESVEKKEEGLESILSLMREIERDYQAEVLTRFRRAICERYYGFHKAD